MRNIPDRTSDLQTDDFFRFNRISVISRRSDPSGKVTRRSGEHRGQFTKHEQGRCIIDRQWDFIDPH